MSPALHWILVHVLLDGTLCLPVVDPVLGVAQSVRLVPGWQVHHPYSSVHYVLTADELGYGSKPELHCYVFVVILLIKGVHDSA